MYYNQCSHQYNHRLQSKTKKQVRPHFAHTTSTADKCMDFTYIKWAIRPTLRTLHTMRPPNLLFGDGGGMHHYALMLQMNPFPSG